MRTAPRQVSRVALMNCLDVLSRRPRSRSCGFFACCRTQELQPSPHQGSAGEEELFEARMGSLALRPADSRPLHIRGFIPANLSGHGRPDRPAGSYALNRQLTQKAPFILQVHEHLSSACGRVIFHFANRSSVGSGTGAILRGAAAFGSRKFAFERLLKGGDELVASGKLGTARAPG